LTSHELFPEPSVVNPVGQASQILFPEPEKVPPGQVEQLVAAEAEAGELQRVWLKARIFGVPFAGRTPKQLVCATEPGGRYSLMPPEPFPQPPQVLVVMG